MLGILQDTEGARDGRLKKNKIIGFSELNSVSKLRTLDGKTDFTL